MPGLIGYNLPEVKIPEELTKVFEERGINEEQLRHSIVEALLKAFLPKVIGVLSETGVRELYRSILSTKVMLPGETPLSEGGKDFLREYDGNREKLRKDWNEVLDKVFLDDAL